MSLYEVKFEIGVEGVDLVDERLLELGVEGWSTKSWKAEGRKG